MENTTLVQKTSVVKDLIQLGVVSLTLVNAHISAAKSHAVSEGVSITAWLSLQSRSVVSDVHVKLTVQSHKIALHKGERGILTETVKFALFQVRFGVMFEELEVLQVVTKSHIVKGVQAVAASIVNVLVVVFTVLETQANQSIFEFKEVKVLFWLTAKFWLTVVQSISTLKESQETRSCESIRYSLCFTGTILATNTVGNIEFLIINELVLNHTQGVTAVRVNQVEVADEFKVHDKEEPIRFDRFWMVEVDEVA